MRLIAAASLVAVLAAETSSSPDVPSVPASDQPVYTSSGELTFPSSYREWVFLGSGLGMTYGPAAPRPGENPSFDNVFVNPAAYKLFKESGHWPDGTMFALEVRYSTSHGSINKGGHYQSDLAAVEMHVKDSKRFKDTNGMAFFGFGGGVNAPTGSAPALPADAGCIACHTKSGAVDATFVQFYPTALAVAEAKGTIRADYVPPPPSPAKFGEVLSTKGWAEASKILASAKTEDPYATVLQEGPLNRLAYTLLQKKDHANAIALFQYITEAFPKSANAHDSLADGYEAAGKTAEAAAEADKVIAMVDADPNLQPAGKDQLRKANTERKTRLARK
jgi:hypothetical protein